MSKKKNTFLIIIFLFLYQCGFKVVNYSELNNFNIKEIITEGENKISYKNFINISETKLINCYNEARVLLFPSLYEGFGLPIIEAQRMCVPVITSNISPMKDIAKKSAVFEVQ